jgi:hypothetical protein
MRAVVVIAGGAALAAAAAATVYVEEDFEGGFPPTGWIAEGRWSQEFGGPSGAFAAGVVGCGVGSAHGDFKTYEFAVDANETVYYRFDYRAYDAGYPSTWGADFYLVYTDPPNEVIKGETLRTAYAWKEHAANAVASRAGSARAYWHLRVTCVWRWAGAEVHLDDVAIGDQPDVMVAPASLGSVKALFR